MARPWLLGSASALVFLAGAAGCSARPIAVASTVAPARAIGSTGPTATEPPAHPVPNCGLQGTADACQRACEAGLAASCYRLGRIRSGDVPTPADIDRVEAAAAFGRACDQNLAVACDALGSLHAGETLERDYPKALRLHQKACDAGLAVACAHVAALRIASEPGVEASSDHEIQAALEILGRACHDGDAASCRVAGAHYFTWYRGMKDAAKARAFADEACARGDRLGCELAAAVRRSRSATAALRDEAGATAYDRRAFAIAQASCEQRYDACVELGDYQITGLVAPGDRQAAVRSRRWGCESGKRPDSCALLGYAYTQGSGVPRDYALAKPLLEMACHGGAAFACGELARLYRLGLGSPVDLPRSFAYTATACKLGGAEDCDITGTYFHEGIGVQRSDEKALALRRRACGWRNDVACGALGRWLVAHDGRGAPLGARLVEAATCFRRRCYLSGGKACFELALVHSRGWGVPKDAREAGVIARVGCTDGDKDACAWLANLKKVPKWVQERDAKDAETKDPAGGLR